VIEFRINAKSMEELASQLRVKASKLQDYADEFVAAALAEAKRVAQTIVPVRTGMLRASIDYEFMGRGRWSFSAGMPYAGFVEYGTSKMAARPYMRPALERFVTIVETEMDKYIIDRLVGD